MHYCRANLLGFLLTSWPEGKIRLRRNSLYLPNVWNANENDTYNGESVGILWELFRAKNVRLKDYEAMLILLLERGESLNEVCGPGGTALHGCITSEDQILYTHVVEMILNHGADPNVSGPRGTPLQLVWRVFRSLSFVKGNIYWTSHQYLRDIMRLLLKFGADPFWVEPNGISIDRRTIEAWCAMSEEELKARWDDDDYPYCKSNWFTYEFRLYRSAQKLRPGEHTESHGKTYLERSVTP